MTGRKTDLLGGAEAGSPEDRYPADDAFPLDHIGAMDALSKLIPIGMHMDHGDSVELIVRR